MRGRRADAPGESRKRARRWSVQRNSQGPRNPRSAKLLPWSPFPSPSRPHALLRAARLEQLDERLVLPPPPPAAAGPLALELDKVAAGEEDGADDEEEGEEEDEEEDEEDEGPRPPPALPSSSPLPPVGGACGRLLPAGCIASGQAVERAGGQAGGGGDAALRARALRRLRLRPRVARLRAPLAQIAGNAARANADVCARSSELELSAAGIRRGGGGLVAVRRMVGWDKGGTLLAKSFKSRTSTRGPRAARALTRLESRARACAASLS